MSMANFHHIRTAHSCRAFSTLCKASETHRKGDSSMPTACTSQAVSLMHFCLTLHLRCRQGLIPTNHAQLNRQAIKQMSNRNRESKEDQARNEAHNRVYSSRPVVKTPMPSRSAIRQSCNTSFWQNNTLRKYSLPALLLQLTE